MLRLIIYIFIISILAFIPFNLNTKKNQPVLINKNSAVRVSLVEPSKPKAEVIAPKEVVKKPKKKPKPKKLIKKAEPQKIKPKPAVEEKIVPKEVFQELLEEKTVVSTSNEISKTAYQNSLKQSYYDTIYQEIDAQKHYPKKALRFKQEGDVVVSFIVLENGEITKFQIVEPSEFESLNKEIKNVFKKLKRFSKPPSEIEIPLEVTITIRFKITKE